MSTAAVESTLDTADLEEKVKDTYRRVAVDPSGAFHFEMGRALAERLGYDPRDLDRIPMEALDSFAGVGYHFDLARIGPGNHVLDLGSGSGTDTFVAALKTGKAGKVYGIDMTDAQREKAERLCRAAGVVQISYHRAYIEDLPLDKAAVDVVISNGVINLCADKAQVFREAARVLKPGGRFAVSDIVSRRPLPADVTCNATLWAACIGGAIPESDYLRLLMRAGLTAVTRRANPQYRFLSASAQKACAAYGVRSVSILAVRK